MTTISVIRTHLTYLLKNNPNIHIDIPGRRSQKARSDIAAVITAIYPNVFTCRITENGVEKDCTYQYVDILTHNMTIKELEY